MPTKVDEILELLLGKIAELCFGSPTTNIAQNNTQRTLVYAWMVQNELGHADIVDWFEPSERGGQPVAD